MTVQALFALNLAELGREAGLGAVTLVAECFPRLPSQDPVACLVHPPIEQQDLGVLALGEFGVDVEALAGSDEAVAKVARPPLISDAHRHQGASGPPADIDEREVRGLGLAGEEYLQVYVRVRRGPPPLFAQPHGLKGAVRGHGGQPRLHDHDDVRHARPR
jgi:hypothetical protein